MMSAQDGVHSHIEAYLTPPTYHIGWWPITTCISDTAWHQAIGVSADEAGLGLSSEVKKPTQVLCYSRLPTERSLQLVFAALECKARERP
jgi:hypothetical protein